MRNQQRQCKKVLLIQFICRTRAMSVVILTCAVWKPCGFGAPNLGHSEGDESIGWKTSIGEVFGTFGYSQPALTPVSQVNECYREIYHQLTFKASSRLFHPEDQINGQL